MPDYIRSWIEEAVEVTPEFWDRLLRLPPNYGLIEARRYLQMAPGNLRQPNALDRVLDCVLALMDNDDPKKAKKGAELYDLLAQRQDIANGPLAGWSHAGPAAMATELLEWWVEGGVRPSFLESVPELWKQEEREEWENAPTVEKAGLASGAILPGTSTAGSKPGKKGGAKGKE